MLLKSLFIILPVTLSLAGALPTSAKGTILDKIVYRETSPITFGGQVLEKVLIGTVQVVSGTNAKLQEAVQTVAVQRDGFVAASASSSSSIQQAQNNAQNLDQQTTSARPYSYSEQPANAGNRDSNKDNLNHQNTNSQSYQTSVQGSPSSYSQQDNERTKTNGQPLPNNGIGYSNDNANSNEGGPYGSGSDNNQRDNAPNYKPATSTARWTTQTSQEYNSETSPRPTQNTRYQTSTIRPSTPSRRQEAARPPPEHTLDPNPILSPVDRVPIMIEYPKIDYDKVELTTRAPLNKNPNRHKNKPNQGNDRSPDSS